MDHALRMFVACADADNTTGIFHYDLDSVTGELRLAGETRDINTCLYLNQHPTLPILYAVGAFRGEAHIHAFRIEPDSGLTLINQQPTNGYEACYVAVAGAGRYALIVNYTGPAKAGSIAAFPLQPDGSILMHTAHIQLSGQGATLPRQDASHPHMIVPTPDDRYVLVPDLGTDRVMIYRLDRDSGQLLPHTQPHIAIQTGSGPRHLAFHPNRRVLYVLSELRPVLTIITYDAAGRFDIVETHPTLPPQDAVPANNLGADIHVTPSGRFLYVSNRGHNSLGICGLDPSGTAVTYVGHQSTLGDWPRSFALDPSGRMLVVANQHTNDLHTFHINATTGHLTPTGHSAMIPAPVCVKFMTSGIHAG